MNNEIQGANNILPSVKDEFCVWSNAGKAALEYDVSEEYVLPDYLPDIKRILLVRAKTEDDEEAVGEGKAEYSGNVVFYVVYQADNGKIKTITPSYPYTNYVSLESIFEDSIIKSDTSVKSRSARAVSPRKLLLKAKVTTELSVYNKLCVSPRLVGGSGVSDEFTLERDVEMLECIDYRKFSEADIRVSEDIEYKGRAPITELVWCDADIFMTDCKYNDGKISLKGAAIVRCLVGTGTEEDMQYEFVEKNLSFDRSFEAKLPFDKCTCRGRLIPGAFEYGVSNDSYGESRIIEIDFVCCAEITAASNGVTMFTNDVFSTAYKYENVYKEVETEKNIKSGFANFSCDGKSGDISNENGEIKHLLLSNVEGEITSFERVGEKCVFSGQCNVRAVLADQSGECSLTDFSFPVRYEMPVGDVGEINATVSCKVLDSKVNYDGNTVNAAVELEVMYDISEKLKANTVSQIIIDKSCPVDEKKDKCMILYYPEEGETLWRIAKKYNVSRASIERANNRQLTEKLPRVIVVPTK